MEKSLVTINRSRSIATNLLLSVSILLCVKFQAQSMLSGQGRYTIVSAEKFIEQAMPEKLNGKVDSIKVTILETPNSKKPLSVTTWRFSPKGKLTEIHQKEHGTNKRTKLEYDSATNARLAKVIITGTSEVVTRKYNSRGLIEEERLQSKESKALNHTAIYSYSPKADKVKIKYSYDVKESPWDRTIYTEYVFAFDKNGNLVSEKLAYSPGKTHMTITYNYASDNKLISINHLSSCWGSNSCIKTGLRYTYDKKGNVIDELATDETVRNADWCYCYHFTAKYDDKNNIVEKIYNSDLSGIGLITKNDPSHKITYSYVYDAKGNWISRSEFQNNKARSITQREISYYP
jgi:hypothetical protein